MGKIAIITDSTSDITKDMIEKYDIKVFPLQIIYKSRIYRDKVDITPEQIYRDMEKEVPKTSLPLTADVVRIFDSLKAEGYTDVLGVFISSGLSGTYNMVRNIAIDYEDSMNIELIDSKSISWGMGFALIEGAKAVEEGKTFTEVTDIVKEGLKNTRAFFVIPTLYYLKKGGRMGRVEGTLGDMLNIKPIVSVDEAGDGQYFTVKKVRGRKKSLAAIYDVVEGALKGKKAFDVAVLHGGAQEEADAIAEKFRALEGVRTVVETQVSPVIGVHTGPGLVALCISAEEGLPRLKEDK